MLLEKNNILHFRRFQQKIIFSGCLTFFYIALIALLDLYWRARCSTMKASVLQHPAASGDTETVLAR